MAEALRERLLQLREKLEAGGTVSGREVLDLFEQALAGLEKGGRLDWLAAEQRLLDERLRAVENSRVFRALRAVGKLWARWRRSPPGELRPDPDYGQWIALEQAATPPPGWFAGRIQRFGKRPTFTLCLPTVAAPGGWVEATLESLARQYYPDWELLLAEEQLAGLRGADARIRGLRSPARGDYVASIEAGAALAPHALFCLARAVQGRELELIYSDEDRLDEDGARMDPLFKPAWSPELLSTGIYPGRLLVVSRAAVEAAGGIGPGFALDQGLARRLAQHRPRVAHLPRVLYHGRTARKAPSVTLPEEPTIRPLVSLIICSAQRTRLERCLRAIARTTTYANREVVVLQHGAGDPWPVNPPGVVVRFEGPFNFAVMNNLGARAAQGDILVSFNDDVEPLEASWLSAMVGLLQRPEVGIVGARLLYPSGAIQHAGIDLGIMEATGHPGRGTFGSRHWPWPGTRRNLAAVTGACLGIRKTVFEQLGGFDPEFPVNYNDVDLCLRARAAGLEVLYEPAAVLRHRECQSRPAGTHRWERQRLFARWGMLLLEGDPYYNPNLTATTEDAGLALEEALGPARFPEGR